MTSEVFDFNDFWREWKELYPDDEGPEVEPKKIRVQGKDYVLPTTLPALTVLRMMREERRTFTQILNSGALIFGSEVLEEWAANGMTVPEIVSVITTSEHLIRGIPGDKLMEIYFGDEEEGVDDDSKKLTSTLSETGDG